ncbi:ABC transporter substrate-binding protein [Acidiplasma cupricumulans]|uniref:ABC transporter substrate-binding protein n=1 Tax=Acidiplasma cupricumulans TaxID=312540 RepID=A0A0Q0VUE3_9ARCH|nr:ABC transporter substrate-binding protein [Acidiplasma cupricumulans]KQB35242.1 ABC transporter substrate-binding protein [Acidiplasma cupricumulans]
MKKGLKIAIAIVVVVVVVAVSFLALYHPPEVFTDTSQRAAPEQLDPATGFFTTNGPLFAALFNGLVEFNGSSTSVVPVLASSYTVHNDQNYTFTLRPYAKFSNGQALNATSVWFSFERGIIMGQGPYVSDYPGILFNSTVYSYSGIAIPNGTLQALEHAGYKIPDNAKYNNSGTILTDQPNYTVAAMDLDNILSNFNYNHTEMEVMEYPYQALVVNNTYNFTINTMVPYSYLLQDIAGWWGDIVEPSDVDAHGGVTYNTPNSYLDANGVIGSGPYIISSVGKGLSTIVLKANPNYWVVGHTSQVPSIAQPAHIKTVVIKYGLTHADRLEDFDRGISQISTIGPTSFKQMINGFYNKSERTSALVHSYPTVGTFYISMNMQDKYTSNLHFREALYNALNYSAMLAIYKNNYNGTPEAYEELGPLSPIYGSQFYNPNNFPLPAQNLTAAEQNISAAGKAMGFYVTLPNGTRLGDTSGSDLSSHTFTITGISPFNAVETSEITVAIDSFKLIGLTFNSAGVTESTVNSWTNASATPQFVFLGWLPDYPDPIGQQLIPVYDASEGGAFGGNDAWVDNGTLQSYFTYLDFVNHTDQVNLMPAVQKVVYDQFAYMWTPMPNDVFFVSPLVKGFVFNSITSAYFYNLMTLTGKLIAPPVLLTLYPVFENFMATIEYMVPKF